MAQGREGGSRGYLSGGATTSEGLCGYCLKRSSKAWPTVLMTLRARPPQHSRMWQAGEGGLVMRHQHGLASRHTPAHGAPTHTTGPHLSG